MSFHDPVTMSNQAKSTINDPTNQTITYQRREWGNLIPASVSKFVGYRGSSKDCKALFVCICIYLNPHVLECIEIELSLISL
jgi:hypothetical protein